MRVGAALARAVRPGIVAGLTSTAALAVAARLEGRGPLQPTNATSHWLHGRAAADRRGADLRHTGVGFLTNLLATVFWAALLQLWAEGRGRRRATLAEAAVVSALAVPADYLLTPRRFTPGWEFVLSRPAMAAAYAAMAAGLYAGRPRDRSPRG